MGDAGAEARAPGLYGFLLIGIIAGYTSTLAGLLNFGASTLLNDVYLRAIRPSATTQPREQLWAARVGTLLVAVAGNLWAWLLLDKIDAAWINFMNSVVLLFVLPVGLLRWLWWRLNIYGEMVPFVIGFPLAYFAWFGVPLLGLPAYKDRPYWQAFLVLFGLGMAITVAVTLLTPAERRDTLSHFYRTARPPGFRGRSAPSHPLALRRGGPAFAGSSGPLHQHLCRRLGARHERALVLRVFEGGCSCCSPSSLSVRVLRMSNRGSQTAATASLSSGGDA